MRKRTSFLVASAFAVVFALSGCRTIRHQDAGGVIGSIGGGIIGSQIGKGKGKIAAIIAGTIIGGLLGSEIGQQLDERDKLLMSQKTQEALEKSPSHKRNEWRNPDTDHWGDITPKQTFKDGQGRYCREFQQTIVIGQKTERAYGTACRQPDGSWKIEG